MPRHTGKQLVFEIVRMSAADQARIALIATYSYVDAAGATQPLLNDDEVKNLSISRGTLTREERAIINHHIIASIDMLEALPWPKHLEKVPEYAGGHHERMDGKGYPCDLRGDQMSISSAYDGDCRYFRSANGDGSSL